MPGYRYHMDFFPNFDKSAFQRDKWTLFFIPIGKILEKANLCPEKSFEANAH